MTVTLTSRQMLQTWRSCAGLEPLSADCTIERFDGIDIDSRLSGLMRQWYLDLLDQGDPQLIGAPVEASAQLALAIDDDDYIGRVICPPSVRKLCSLRVTGWQRDVTVVDRTDVSAILPLQSNPYSRAGACDPIAWREADGEIYVIPANTGSYIVAALAVTDPGEDVYRLDTRALSTINDYLSKHFL